MAKILSIEIDNKNIRIIEGSKTFNSLKINKAIIFECPENSIDDGRIIDLDACVNAIKQELKKNKINARKATIIINNKNLIMRTIELPYLKNKSEANMLLNNELEQLMTIDFDLYKIFYVQRKKSSTDNGQFSNYIVYGISYDIFNQYMELSKKLNLDIIRFDLSFRAIEKLYSRKFKLNKNEQMDLASSTAFVDINYDTITFSAMSSDAVEFSRTYESGVKTVINNYSTLMSLDEKTSLEDLYNISLDSDIKANILKQNIIQESMGEWTDEFNRFIRYYNSNNKDKPIKKIYVYGAFSNINGLDKFIENRLNIETKILDKISNVSINKKIIKSFSFRTYLSVVLSLYLNDKDVNFLTESKKKLKKEVTLGATIFASTLSLIAIVLFFIYSNTNEKSSFISKISGVDLYLNNEQNIKYNKMAIDLQKSVSILEQYKKDAEDVKNILKHEDIVNTKIIQAVFSALPKGSKINSMSLSKERLSIQCESPSMVEIAQFEKNLREYNFIYSVNIPTTTESNGSFYYSVECLLKDVSEYEAD